MLVGSWYSLSQPAACICQSTNILLLLMTTDSTTVNDMLLKLRSSGSKQQIFGKCLLAFSVKAPSDKPMC